METTKDFKFNSVKIEGERVLMSSITSKYCDHIFREFTKEITRFMFPSSPSELSQVDSFIELSKEGMNNKTDLVLVITNINSGEFLGVCSLHGRKNPQEPELGIWLKKTAQLQGFGFETINYLVKWIKENIVFNYLVYPVDKDNIPSRKIAENLGGKIFREEIKESMSGTILNEVAYKIT